MRLQTLMFTIFTALFMVVKPLQAATIEIAYENPEGVSLIYLSGSIEEGDALLFQNVIEGVSRGIVILESPGGLLSEGISIGSLIRLRSLSTSVFSGSECYSACALIWIAGINRYMSDTAIIGFHAAYVISNGVAQESGTANAEVGSYLTHLGLGIDAIRFATIAGPSEAMLLSPELARAFGIDIILQSEGGVLTDQHGTNANDYAMNFVNIAYWHQTCEFGFGELPLNIMDEQREAFDQGSRLLGKGGWVDAYVLAMDTLLSFSDANGELLTCINVEEQLRANLISTGFEGPSFDCINSATPTEFAICSDPGVWASDHIMSSIHLGFKRQQGSDEHANYLKGQKAWLIVRDSCGSDVNCIKESYLMRLRVLSRTLGFTK